MVQALSVFCMFLFCFLGLCLRVDFVAGAGMIAFIPHDVSPLNGFICLSFIAIAACLASRINKPRGWSDDNDRGDNNDGPDEEPDPEFGPRGGLGLEIPNSEAYARSCIPRRGTFRLTHPLLSAFSMSFAPPYGLSARSLSSQV